MKRGAISGQAFEFRPTKFFSFFTWGETRQVSPHAARASRLLVGGWGVAVGRYCLSFAQGVGQNLLRRGVIRQELRGAASDVQNSPHILLDTCSDLDTRRTRLPSGRLRAGSRRAPRVQSGAVRCRLNVERIVGKCTLAHLVAGNKIGCF